jgi:hypothetical protein
LFLQTQVMRLWFAGTAITCRTEIKALSGLPGRLIAKRSFIGVSPVVVGSAQKVPRELTPIARPT